MSCLIFKLEQAQMICLGKISRICQETGKTTRQRPGRAASLRAHRLFPEAFNDQTNFTRAANAGVARRQVSANTEQYILFEIENMNLIELTDLIRCFLKIHT